MSTLPITNCVTFPDKTYTLNDAIDYMREIDSLPTNNTTIQWYDVNTKKKVIIGYNDQPSKSF